MRIWTKEEKRREEATHGLAGWGGGIKGARIVMSIDSKDRLGWKDLC